MAIKNSNILKFSPNALSRLSVSVCLFFLFVALTAITQGQSRVIIKQSRQIIGTTSQGDQVRKLLGDVHLITERLTMFSDSAYQYLDSSRLEAFGNIQLETEEDTIWSDHLFYNLKTDIVDLTGRVVIRTDSATIFGNNVIYSLEKKIARFSNNILLIDDEGKLRADRGIYFQKEDSAVFRGHVQVKDSTQYLEGDSLFTNRRTKNYKFYGDIYGRDDKNNVVLTTDYLQVDSSGTRRLRGNSYIMKVSADTSDTTHMWADKITYTDYDTTYNIVAVNNVKTWSEQFSSVSDTIRYFDETEEFNLYGQPKAWHENLQLSGTYIQANLKNQELDSLLSYPKPFIAQHDSILDRINQIKGDTLHANFNEGVIQSVRVFPNSQLLRFIKDENNTPNGVIRVNTPAYITIEFKNGEIEHMKSGANSEGNYIPESPVITDIQLDGFIWTPELRPERPASIPASNMRPFTDEPPFELPERYKKWKD